MQSHVCVSVLYMTKPLGYRIKIYSIFLVDFERSAEHSNATIGMLDKPIRGVTRCINIGHHDRVQFAIAQIVTCQYDGVILFKVADASQGNGISEENPAISIELVCFFDGFFKVVAAYTYDQTIPSLTRTLCYTVTE